MIGVLNDLKTATLWLASGTEAAAALIISLAVIEGVARALILFIPRPGVGRADDASQNAKEVVRLKLGRWLALALEFELAADILRTAVAPTWSEIGQLAAIAALRTALNFSFNARSTAPNAGLRPEADKRISTARNCNTYSLRRVPQQRSSKSFHSTSAV